MKRSRDGRSFLSCASSSEDGGVCGGVGIEPSCLDSSHWITSAALRARYWIICDETGMYTN